ncbi:hypothetical protein XENORESO_005815 [Xenotaenia resolanae]|uniref:Uncharacterized protein n=1 Tax=Xenotaenia resolanae TaxID=208358 RepID=A0ABV0WCY9_9TELE
MFNWRTFLKWRKVLHVCESRNGIQLVCVCVYEEMHWVFERMRKNQEQSRRGGSQFPSTGPVLKGGRAQNFYCLLFIVMYLSNVFWIKWITYHFDFSCIKNNENVNMQLTTHLVER